MMLTSVTNQTGLPHYFAQVFYVAQSLENGQLDFVLGDGRIFRVEGRHPDPGQGIAGSRRDQDAGLSR